MLDSQWWISVMYGTAQGSILGSDLWDVLYESLLRTTMPIEFNAKNQCVDE